MEKIQETTEGVDEKQNGVNATQSNTSILPEDILKEAGGCGRYQIRMSVVIHLIKTIVCFSSYNLIIFSATPKWYCTSKSMRDDNITCFKGNGICEEEKDICQLENDTECRPDPEFNTYVGEFKLVCDNDFLPNMINSINIAGVVMGNLIGGQLADLFGRKQTFFGSLLLLLAFHLVAYFSQTWQMLAAAFFFTGVGCGFFLTVQFTILSEYSLSRWRVWMIGFPSWPLQSSLFALIAWLVHDWRILQLMIALMVLPAFLSWFVLPESFRWFIAHKNPKQAVNIIETIAKFNKKNDYHHIAGKVLLMRNLGDDRKYTFIHLFKTKRMVKTTFLLTVIWASLDTVSYGIAFGLQLLSGNIYLNLVMFSAAGIPSKAVAIWLQNRFGRRAATILGFCVIAITGLTAGIVQISKPANKDVVAKVCIFVANAGVVTAWGPLQTLTIELYPTVVRNIGYGFLNVVGKAGAVIGPQLVYLNAFVPGILFLVCGGLSLISIVVLLFLPETKDQNLQDEIEIKPEIELNVITDRGPMGRKGSILDDQNIC